MVDLKGAKTEEEDTTIHETGMVPCVYPIQMTHFRGSAGWYPGAMTQSHPFYKWRMVPMPQSKVKLCHYYCRCYCCYYYYY